MAVDPVRDSHPNVVRRGPVYFAFACVLVAGALGGGIGYGLVDASCSETPTKLHQLLSVAADALRAPTTNCDFPLAAATVLGALVTAMGAGIVAQLVLRAMTDWKKTPPEEA